MNLFVLTQTDEIINLRGIAKILPMEGEANDVSSGEDIPVWLINAYDESGNEIQLGIYREENSMLNTWKALKKWLNNSVYPLFEIPVEEET